MLFPHQLGSGGWIKSLLAVFQGTAVLGFLRWRDWLIFCHATFSLKAVSLRGLAFPGFIALGGSHPDNWVVASRSAHGINVLEPRRALGPIRPWSSIADSRTLGIPGQRIGSGLIKVRSGGRFCLLQKYGVSHTGLNQARAKSSNYPLPHPALICPFADLSNYA